LIHIKIENFGRAIEDCKDSIKCDPSNVKAYFRAAQASFSLRKYQQAIDFCKQTLEIEPKNKLAMSLMEKSNEQYKIQQEQRAKQEAVEQARIDEEERMLSALRERKICMGEKLYRGKAEYEGTVHWDEENANCLRWPIMFLYPEHEQSDFIQSFGEHDRLVDLLAMMFPQEERVEWDPKGRYVYTNLVVYFQTNSTNILGESTNYKKQSWVLVDPNKTLLDAMQLPGHVIPQFPVFSVFVRGSSFLKEFLQKS